jgi:hypothetical protein
MSKATAVFDADDSRLGAAPVRINQRMLALQSRIAKFAGAWVAVRAVAISSVPDSSTCAGRSRLATSSTIFPRTRVWPWPSWSCFRRKSSMEASLRRTSPRCSRRWRSRFTARPPGDTIQRLGFDLDDLKHKTPAEPFRALGAAINNVKDPSQRAAMAKEDFGRCGAELLSVFTSNGFDDAAQQLGAQAQILGRDAALLMT